MKLVYCSNCGKALPIRRKAMPKFAKILDIIDPHECSENLEMPELTPTNVPMREGKLEKELNKMSPKPSVYGVSTDNLRDRRIGAVDLREQTNNAPKSILDSLIKPTKNEEGS